MCIRDRYRAIQKNNVIFRPSKNSIPDDKESISVRLLVRGKVQGVYFRFNLQQVAMKNSVVGWVRNLPDGNVEALLEGKKEDVNQVVQWSKIGPENARVYEVKMDYGQYTGKYKDFMIRYDNS